MAYQTESNTIFARLAKIADKELRILLREHTEKRKYPNVKYFTATFCSSDKKAKIVLWGHEKKHGHRFKIREKMTGILLHGTVVRDFEVTLDA